MNSVIVIASFVVIVSRQAPIAKVNNSAGQMRCGAKCARHTPYKGTFSEVNRLL